MSLPVSPVGKIGKKYKIFWFPLWFPPNLLKFSGAWSPGFPPDVWPLGFLPVPWVALPDHIQYSIQSLSNSQLGPSQLIGQFFTVHSSNQSYSFSSIPFHSNLSSSPLNQRFSLSRLFIFLSGATGLSRLRITLHLVMVLETFEVVQARLVETRFYF